MKNEILLVKKINEEHKSRDERITRKRETRKRQSAIGKKIGTREM